MRTKPLLLNHLEYQRTKMILRNPLTSPVRGARQNGRAPSRAFGRAQKAIYAGSIRIPQDAGYRGYAEDIQLEQQLIRKLLYSPTGLSTFFLEFVQNWFAFSKKPSVLIFGYVPIFPETLLKGHGENRTSREKPRSSQGGRDTTRSDQSNVREPRTKPSLLTS